jgi:hypothetical protein
VFVLGIRLRTNPNTSYVYFNNSPADDWALRERSLGLADETVGRIKQQLDEDLSQGVGAPSSPLTPTHPGSAGHSEPHALRPSVCRPPDGHERP